MFWILFLLIKTICCSSEQRAFQLDLNEECQCVREVTLLMYLNGFVLTRHPQTTFPNYDDDDVFALLKSFHLLYGGARISAR